MHRSGSVLFLFLGFLSSTFRFHADALALGFFQFVFFGLLTWVYVRRANGEFDTLNEQIVQDAVRKA